MSIPRYSFALALLGTLALAAPPSAPSAPLANLGMEQGAPGAAPAGWLAAGEGYAITASEASPHGGKRCASIVTRPDRKQVRFAFDAWHVAPEAPRITAKVAFLADGRAISYAESYLGVVEHHRLAEIVGAPTAGTNGNVNPFTLPGGYQVVWTGMKVLKQDGSRHHGVGILPTIPAARTLAGVRAGRDEVLEAGIAAVKVGSRQ